VSVQDGIVVDESDILSLDLFETEVIGFRVAMVLFQG